VVLICMPKVKVTVAAACLEGKYRASWHRHSRAGAELPLRECSAGGQDLFGYDRLQEESAQRNDREVQKLEGRLRKTQTFIFRSGMSFGKLIGLIVDGIPSDQPRRSSFGLRRTDSDFGTQ